MMKNNETDKKTVELNIDPNLKTVLVDNIFMATRSDGVSLVRLSTNLPEGLFEQIRFMASEKTLKNIVDVICSNLHYRPNLESKEVKSSTK